MFQRKTSVVEVEDGKSVSETTGSARSVEDEA
jgi:hypothetical protein